MKNIISFTLFFIIIVVSETSAQWVKISNQNVGTSGKIHSYNSVIFIYGIANNFRIYRSSDNGQSWSANFANNFPYDVYNMFNYNNEIFAITTTLGQNIWRFYTSGDEGLTWSEKSNIQNVTGNGAILSMTLDGNKLFAVSNRKSFYTSTDGGVNWSETIINYPTSQNMIYFAASGNVMVAVFTSLGAVVSTDGGQNWSVNNPTNPVSVINYVINFNGSIYGTTQSGVSKFNPSTNSWDNFSQGLPDPSSFQFAKILYKFENTLYFGTVGFLDSKPHFFYSNNGGVSWDSLTNSGLTTISLTTVPTSFAVNSQYIFLYDYKNNTNEASLYILQNNVTSIENGFISPTLFELSQNYPNPFNPSTKISFSIPNSEYVTLKVYDVIGNEIATLVNENLSAGTYSYNFDASKLTSGIYFYKLQAGKFSETRKMILTK